MSHLCNPCRKAMCPDCREIAAENEELLTNYKRANSALRKRKKELEFDVARTQRHATMWEGLARQGLPDVIQQWMDTLKEAA